MRATIHARRSFYADAHYRTNAPWGLQRISQTEKLSNQNTNALTFTYTYDSSAGSGVDIYIVGEYQFLHSDREAVLNASIDTGIYTAHVRRCVAVFHKLVYTDRHSVSQSEFGGRARWGATFGGYRVSVELHIPFWP